VDREAFRQFAELEADHWWFRGRRELYVPLLADVLTRDLGAEPRDMAVMDVGCGVGGFIETMGRFGDVVGLELDEPSVAFCRDRGLRRTLVARSDALPVPAGSQDLLTLWDVIEHTPDDLAVLREMRRCLRPGGHVAVSVPAYQFLYANNDRVARHYRRYTRRRLTERMTRAGFEVRKATYVNVTLSPVIIPAVLAIKLKERLVPVTDDSTTNLSWKIPDAVNSFLASVFRSEHRWLRHVSAPFGHSIFAVGRRPERG